MLRHDWNPDSQLVRRSDLISVSTDPISGGGDVAEVGA